MPPKNPQDLTPVIRTMKLKYKDVFSLGEFYDGLAYWIQERGWKSFDNVEEQWETYFSEKIAQSGAKEMWFWWRLAKPAPDTNVNPKTGESETIQFHLFLTFHIIGLASTEVIKGGQKIKADKGEMEIETEAYIDEIYKKKFKEEKGFFGFVLKEATNIFTKRIYVNTLDQRKKELYQEAYALNNFIKQWLKMKRYLPYEESKNFFPSYAWPSHHKDE